MAKKKTDKEDVISVNSQATKKKDNSISDSDMLSRCITDYTLAEDYKKKNYFQTWKDCYMLYNNKRVHKGYNGGMADVFIPEVFTIVESIVANVGAANPTFDYVRSSPEQEDQVDVLNKLTDYWWDKSRLSLKTQSWTRDSILYGMGVMFGAWDSKKNCPAFKNIPLWDFFIDPSATTLEDAGYCGHRYLTSISNLKRQMIYDAKSGKYVEKYKGLDQLSKHERPSTGQEEDLTDKELKETVLGGSTIQKLQCDLKDSNGASIASDRQQEQVEVIYYCTYDEIIEVANRKVVIYRGENPYHKKAETKTISVERYDEATDDTTYQDVEQERPAIGPFYPYATLRNYIDPSLFYGTGDIERVIGHQERINDIANMEQDNLAYMINSTWIIDPSQAHLKNKIKSKPGFVIVAPPNLVRQADKPIDNGSASRMIASGKEEMRRTTSANEVAQGFISSGGRKSATEIEAQMKTSSQRFATKLRNMENEGFKQLAKMMLDMARIFMVKPEPVRVIKDGKANFISFNPNEYWGEYEPMVMLESSSKALAIERGQEYANLFNVLERQELIDKEKLLEQTLPSMFPMIKSEAKELIRSQADIMNQKMEEQKQMMAVEKARQDMGIASSGGQQAQAQQAQLAGAGQFPTGDPSMEQLGSLLGGAMQQQ